MLIEKTTLITPDNFKLTDVLDAIKSANVDEKVIENISVSSDDFHRLCRDADRYMIIDYDKGTHPIKSKLYGIPINIRP